MCLHQLKRSNSLGNDSERQIKTIMFGLFSGPQQIEMSLGVRVCVCMKIVSVCVVVFTRSGSVLQWTVAFGTTSSTPEA